MTNKTKSYLIEKWGGVAFGQTITIISLLIGFKYIVFKEFIKDFSSIGMCIFGFLLTFLGIILQGNSKLIMWLQSRTILYHRFISHNKRVVYISLITTILTYTIGYIDLSYHMYSDLLTAICLGFVSWLFIDLYISLRIFYLLIKKTE